MKKIKSNHLQNYLYENKCYPVYEEYGIAYYKEDDRLYKLLELYSITYYYIPNKI